MLGSESDSKARNDSQVNGTIERQPAQVRKEGSGKKNVGEKKAKTASTGSTLATALVSQNVDWTVAGDVGRDEHVPLPPTGTQKLASLEAALANLAAEERSHEEQRRQ